MMTPSPILHQNAPEGQKQIQLPPMPQLTRLPSRNVPSGHIVNHRHQPIYNLHQNGIYPSRQPLPIKQERVDWYPKYRHYQESRFAQPFPFVPQQNQFAFRPAFKDIRGCNKWAPYQYPIQHQSKQRQQTLSYPNQHQRQHTLPKTISERPQELRSNTNEIAEQLIKQEDIIIDLENFVTEMLTQQDIEDRQKEVKEEPEVKNHCQLKQSHDTEEESAMDIVDDTEVEEEDANHSDLEENAAEEKPGDVPPSCGDVPLKTENDESEKQAPETEYDVSSFIAVLMASFDGPTREVDRKTLLPVEAFLELMENYNLEEEKIDESVESEAAEEGSQESEHIPSPKKDDGVSESDLAESQGSVCNSSQEVSDENVDSEPELVCEKFQGNVCVLKSDEKTESDKECGDYRGNECITTSQEMEVEEERSSPSVEKESPTTSHADDVVPPKVPPTVIRIRDLSHLPINDKGIHLKHKSVPNVSPVVACSPTTISDQPQCPSKEFKPSSCATVPVRMPVVQFPVAYPPSTKHSLASFNRPLPKAVKCLTCFEADKDLSKHMYFGQLQCKYCDHLLINCSNFRNALRTPGRCPAQPRAGHVFVKWNISPVDFLCYRLRKRIMDENKGANATFSEVLDEMEKYVQCLLPLQAWHACAHAIKRCTDYIKNMRAPLEKEEMRKLRSRRKEEVKSKNR